MYYLSSEAIIVISYNNIIVLLFLISPLLYCHHSSAVCFGEGMVESSGDVHIA